MPLFAFLISSFVATLVRIVELLMLVRAIMSWVMPDRSSRLYQIVYGLTEPVIAPVRALVSRISFLQGLPIDMSFLITWLLLDLVLRLLL